MRHWIAKLGIAAMALCLLGLWLPGSSASAGSSSGYYVGSGTQADGGYLATTPTDPRIFDRFTVPTVTCASAPDNAIRDRGFPHRRRGVHTGERGCGCPVLKRDPGVPRDARHRLVHHVHRIHARPRRHHRGDGDGRFVHDPSGYADRSGRDAESESVTPSRRCFARRLPVGVVGCPGDYDDEESGTPLPVPTFTSVRLTGSLNGTTISASGGVPYNLKETTVVDIRTGTLNSLGRAFSETFKNNSEPRSPQADPASEVGRLPHFAAPDGGGSIISSKGLHRG